MLIKLFNQHFSQLTNTELIVRIAKIEDLAFADAIFVFNDPKEPFNTVSYIRVFLSVIKLTKRLYLKHVIFHLLKFPIKTVSNCIKERS